MANPALSKNPYFNGSRRPEEIAPEATMTWGGVLNKSIGMLLVVAAGAAVGWVVPGLALPAILAAFVLSLVIGFKGISNPFATGAFAALEGIAMGAITMFLEGIFPGVGMQALLATFAIVATTTFLYRGGWIRTTPALNRFFIIAGCAYLVFSLLNLGLMLTGVNQSMFGLHSSVEIFGIPLGLILGPILILMGAYSLLADYETIEHGVRNGLPAKMEWFCTFSLVASVAWIYFECLRLISIIRGN